MASCTSSPSAVSTEDMRALWSSGDLLQPSLRARALANIEAMQSKAQHCQLEIDLLLKRVSALREEKKQLQERSDKHAGLLSLVRTLPHDILSEIFIAGLSGRPEVVFMRRSWPYVVSQVCSRWRKIACATPALWSSIDTVTKTFRSSDRMTLLMLWKERAGKQEAKYHASPWSTLSLDAIMQTMPVFTTEVSLIVHNIRSLDGLLLPETHTLDLKLYSGLLNSHVSSSDTSAVQAPKLRFLKIKGTAAGVFPPNFLPWNQITRLDWTLEGSRRSKFKQLVLKVMSWVSPALERLKIVGTGEEASNHLHTHNDDTTQSQVWFPRLRFLDIQNTSDIQIIFAFMKATHLEELRLSDIGSNLDPLITFLRHSANSLTALMLDFPHTDFFSLEDMNSLLKAVPSVKFFRYTKPDMDQEISAIRKVLQTKSQDGYDCLPMLTHLQLETILTQAVCNDLCQLIPLRSSQEASSGSRSSWR
jgi:hypothetical protein